MKKTSVIKSLLLATVVLLTVSLLFTACGQKNTSDSNTPASQTQENKNATTSAVSGSATAVGSSALQPLAEKAAQQFMAKNPKAKVQVQGGGSGTGLTQVAQGGADIGNSDIFAEEKSGIDAKALKDNKVCVVGFATVVNPKIKVENLSQQQLIDIFTGKVTNWKEVGGDDKKIVIINRPASSGTRATFKKYALKGAEEAVGKSLTEDSSGTVRKTVAETEGAIAYLALSYIDSSVKALKFEGFEGNKENITSAKYPIWSYEHMYTKGEPTGVVKAFLDYMLSDEVQKMLVPEMGYIPISEMKVTKQP